MKKIMKRSLALLLIFMMISTSFVSFAAVELNQDAVVAHKGQYKNYVLLGDSVASGYRDQVSENDELFNEKYMDSTYCRYEGSYADVLAKAIIDGDGGKMTALAGPGFRTIEMRYMLEDEFAANCTDEYLFHPSHLYIYDDEYCEECQEYKLPGSEHFRKEFKKSIAEADLITLGIGGNDWGAYLGWVITDILEAENVGDKFIKQAQDIIANNDMDIATVEKLVEVAHLAGALPTLVQQLPKILEYGLGNFYKNWDIMIEDIYALNPDVTLMVVGMSDNSLKGKHYDYEGVEGEVIESAAQPEAISGVVSTVINFIMSIGNKPMIDGAEKFGYIYVDTAGTTYVDSHPDADGHVFIANKIIEALPDREISTKFVDVTPGHKYYKDVEFVISNGIMTETAENTFSPDALLTKGDLAAAYNAINGTDDATDDKSEVSAASLAVSFIGAGMRGGFTSFFKGLVVYCKIIVAKGFDVMNPVTRAEAASYFKLFCE